VLCYIAADAPSPHNHSGGSAGVARTPGQGCAAVRESYDLFGSLMWRPPHLVPALPFSAASVSKEAGF